MWTGWGKQEMLSNPLFENAHLKCLWDGRMTLRLISGRSAVGIGDGHNWSSVLRRPTLLQGVRLCSQTGPWRQRILDWMAASTPRIRVALTVIMNVILPCHSRFEILYLQLVTFPVYMSTIFVFRFSAFWWQDKSALIFRPNAFLAQTSVPRLFVVFVSNYVTHEQMKRQPLFFGPTSVWCHLVAPGLYNSRLDRLHLGSSPWRGRSSSPGLGSNNDHTLDRGAGTRELFRKSARQAPANFAYHKGLLYRSA